MKSPLWQPSRVKTLVFCPFDCPLQHVEETTTTTSGFSVFGPRAMKNAPPSLPSSLTLFFLKENQQILVSALTSSVHGGFCDRRVECLRQPTESLLSEPFTLEVSEALLLSLEKLLPSLETLLSSLTFQSKSGCADHDSAARAFAAVVKKGVPRASGREGLRHVSLVLGAHELLPNLPTSTRSLLAETFPATHFSSLSANSSSHCSMMTRCKALKVLFTPPASKGCQCSVMFFGSNNGTERSFFIFRITTESR